MASLKRWMIFAGERFDPLSHLVMISLFVAAHFLFALKLAGLPHGALVFFPMLLLATVFFFKLRLYDEIKDYELDVVINPNRPLPRGLLTLSEVKRGIVVCIAVELLVGALTSWRCLGVLVGAIAYSLLMYREFFIPKIIRPHLTTYALTHTIVTFGLSLSLLAMGSGITAKGLPSEAFYFSLMSWPLFNIFEFGRKTFAGVEERPTVDSYSKLFTRFGAVALNLLQVALLIYCGFQIPAFINPYLINYVGMSILPFLFIGSFYALSNHPTAAKAYRAFSSFYIVMIYSGIVIFLFLHRGRP